MRGHVQVCEGQGVCLPTCIDWCCNVSSSQMGSTWVYRTWRQEKIDYVVWFMSNWFDVVIMYETWMPCVNCMKKVQWEGIQLCVFFGWTNIFVRASGSFKGVRVVPHEDGRTFWDINFYIQDTVKPCSHGLLRLDPRGHGGFVKFAPHRHGVARMCLTE